MDESTSEISLYDGPMKLLIVDDGSLDDTIVVASELASQYPQVHALRHPCKTR